MASIASEKHVYITKNWVYLSVDPFDSIWMVLCPAIEVDRAHVFRAGFLPWVAIA